MKHPDYEWQERLLKDNCPGAVWIKFHKAGAERVTWRVRFADCSGTDLAIQDKEAFLAGLHTSVWQARLARVDTDGEIYEIVFAVPKQLSFVSSEGGRKSPS
jgi:hypothetical protein